MQAFLAGEAHRRAVQTIETAELTEARRFSLRPIQGDADRLARGRCHGPRPGPIGHGTQNQPHSALGCYDHFEITAVPNQLETNMSERQDTLKKARDRMIEDRDAHARVLAAPFDRDKAERARIKFVEMQGVIDAIDRAIAGGE
jgi:hypothetical protein